MNKYASMTKEELEEENQRFMWLKEACRFEQLCIKQVMDERSSAEHVQRVASLLSDEEKRALLQIISPKGIEPEEKFGDIGS